MSESNTEPTHGLRQTTSGHSAEAAGSETGVSEAATGCRDHSAAGGWFSNPELLLIVCVMATLTAAVLRAEPLQSANDRSRWCTVWSLIERGTYQIDEIDGYRRFSTIDKVRHRSSDSEPWHFYSSKPPLLSTLVAGLYWVERHTIGLGLFGHTHFVTRLLLVFVNLLPMAAALVSLQRCLLLVRADQVTRMFILATAGFGSMLNPYICTLNNHTPAAISVLFCLTALVRMAVSNSSPTGQPRRRDFIWLGFCAALSCCFELPAALFSVCCFFYACRSGVRRTLTWFVPAAMIPLIAFFLTNWICTGGLKPFYAFYGTEKYVYTHNGVPSYWSQPRGMDANGEPWPVYLFHCILGHHGILSLSPVLMLTLAGWFRAGSRGNVVARSGQSDQSGGLTSDARGDQTSDCHTAGFLPGPLLFMLWLGPLLTVMTLGFYLTRTANYNYGGNSVALRWMLWLTPLWWLAMVPVLEEIRKRPFWLRTAIVLLAISSVSALWSADTPWRPSWLFEAMHQSGWIHYN